MPVSSTANLESKVSLRVRIYRNQRDNGIESVTREITIQRIFTTYSARSR